jgi:hypothetical protein
MNPMLAFGAQEIWDMRMQGKRPNEVVFVSLIGPLNDGNFQVLIAPSDRINAFDWRWARDLSVCLVYHDKVPHERVSELSKLLVRQAPNGGYANPFTPTAGYLWMWDAIKQNGLLLTWFSGYLGIPELGIANEPEMFDLSPMSRFDLPTFKGVTRHE